MKNNTATKWTVGFASVLMVVGHNYENADLDNPRGEIVRERFFAQAEDALGYRRVWGGYYESPEAAEAAYLLFAPPVFLWDEIEPCYGSEAYARNWRYYEAMQIDHEKKMDGVI